jgi:hypothetical protein
VKHPHRFLGALGLSGLVLALAAGCAGSSVGGGEDCAELAQVATSYATNVSQNLTTLETDPAVGAAHISAAGELFRAASNDIGGERNAAAEVQALVDGTSDAAQGISDSGLTDQSRATLEIAVTSFSEALPPLIESGAATESPTPEPSSPR